MEDGHTKPLLFHKAISLLPRNQLLKKHATQKKFDFNVPFVTVLTKKMYQLLFLQPFLYLRLLIIQQIGQMHAILYSDIFGGPQSLNSNYPLQIWILNSKGELNKIEKCLTVCPKLNHVRKRYFMPQQSLSELIGLNQNYPDPTDFHSTIEFLSRHNKLGSVQINYCYSYHKLNGALFWNNPLCTAVFLEAFTTHTCQLGFRVAKLKLTKKSTMTQRIEQVVVESSSSSSAEREPDVKQANKSSAVSVKVAGLNLALMLGILSLEETKHLSVELGKCAVSVWMEYDDLFNARYVTVSALNHFFQTELVDDAASASASSISSWTKVFDFIYKVKFYLTLHKRQILAPLLTKLGKVQQTVHSPYKTCAQKLKYCVEHLTVILFSPDDTCIHAIKFQLSAYLKEKKIKCSSIFLHGSSSNTITMLRTKDFTFLNLNMYLDEDAIFKCKLPKPKIVYSIKRLFNHPKINDTTTVPALCKKRGAEITPQLIVCWLTIGAFFVDHFKLDIFSSHFFSISYLAFVAVWSKYARDGGIFHQGLEKTKFAYENIFRSYSHGGYSFSCKDFLQCGKPLFGTHGEAASTLISLDITSSYGYAGSQIQTPTGFCNAYFDNGVGYLQLCEPFARHKSFEFMSVYYTLYILSLETTTTTLTTPQRRQIKSVFSNFHSTGLFYIKNYPIDLAVIFSNGDISLFQFDGAYAHGCREGCQLFPSFVRGSKRSDLEAQTEKRDNVITLWVKETNEMKTINASYSVITDCHDNEYAVKQLKHSFYSIPLLAKLICGYPTEKTCTKDDVLFSNDNLTFLIVLEGYIPTNSNTVKPLLFKSNKQNWTRSDKTDRNCPMLFSKDYLSWLSKHYNFQVTKIHSVFFYKKCTVLNSVYAQLTLIRMNVNISASIKQLVKNVINFSAGYFGLNEKKKKAKTTFRLMTGLSAKFQTSKHFATYVATINDTNYFIVGTARSNKARARMSVAPFPIFVSIVEFGKQRLSQIMCFFDRFLLPSHYRHLYSNVDNILFVLATETIEQAVDPTLFKEFCQTRLEFFNSAAPLPGFLKQDMLVTADQEWKFVSPILMNYCIKTNTLNDTVFKCLFNNITGEQAFEHSCKMLKKEKLQVEQTRRVAKRFNKDVQIVTFTFNKNK